MLLLKLKKNRIVITRGSSMRPFIPCNSRLIISRNKNPKFGDLLIFRRKNGRVFAHRVVLIKNKYVLTMGDNVRKPEKVQWYEILGRVTHIITPDGNVISLSSFSQRILSILFALRSLFRIALLKIRSNNFVLPIYFQK